MQEPCQLLTELRKEVTVTKDSLNNLRIDFVRMQGKVEVLKASIAELDKKHVYAIDHSITKETFEPVQKVTFGLVTAILIAFVAALLSLILPQTTVYPKDTSNSEAVIYRTGPSEPAPVNRIPSP